MPNGQIGQLAGQPVLILSEGTQRRTGKDATKNNIAAAKAVGDAIKSTLGPSGMDKMLVDSVGDVVISNDGVTVLDEMEIEHPAAKMMVEVAKTQEEEIGDGTTTAVVLTSELLKGAEDLLDQNIHPTVITKGFKIAQEQAIKALKKCAKPIKGKEEESLQQVAMTAMTGKSAERASEHLAKLSVNAIKKMKEAGQEEISVDDVKLEKAQGGSIEDTELINGIVIDKEVVHVGMPKKVENAKIALINTALEVKETETDAKISIKSPEQMEAFVDREEKMLKSMVKSIADSEANVVLCQKGIDDIAQHHLAKKEILAARRIKKSDMEKLASATGGKVMSRIEDLDKEVLGKAAKVEEKSIAGEEMIYVRGCESPRAVSLVIRGGSEHVVDEAERSIKDALGGVIAALEAGEITAGGGAPEEEMGRAVKEYASGYSGRESLAIEAFANALECIPRILAENAGHDPIDTLVEVRASHDEGKVDAGVDVESGKIVNMYDKGVVEPLKIKSQAIKSASESANMILRVDDIISAGGEGPPAGGPPGVPGAPGAGAPGM